MGAFDYAVFNADSTGEVVITTRIQGRWDYEVLDETPDGQVIEGGESTVVWTFPEDVRQAPSETEVATILGKRQASGTIRFRTQNWSGQYVICDGKVDPHPPITRFRGRCPGLVLTFTRVVPV